MGKANRVKAGSKTLDSSIDKGRSIPFFGLSMAGILIVGLAVTIVLATQRESNAGIAPEALKDHWHSSFGVYSCGDFLPPTSNTEHGQGIHSHGDGLIHIHPSSVTAAGPDATIEKFTSAFGANLTDTRYEPGPGEQQVVLDESAGCDGKPADLKLAVWPADGLDGDPKIIDTSLSEYNFKESGEAVTLALVPEGEEVPINPYAEDALTYGASQ